jgi:hypothetical protein
MTVPYLKTESVNFSLQEYPLAVLHIYHILYNTVYKNKKSIIEKALLLLDYASFDTEWLYIFILF